MAREYPQTSLDHIPGNKVQEITHSLNELHAQGRVETDLQVNDRINAFFQLCEDSQIRPGIETLCFALGITRQTLMRWSRGVNCSEYRQELITTAKAYIAAYIEQSTLSGLINPVSGIFLMKNWLGYKSDSGLDETMDDEGKGTALKTSELPKLTVNEPQTITVQSEEIRNA
jgi:hypothetical protein